LSIAANCRLCLVQVEKAPKPLPACATPVTNGMKVMTHSENAVKAQKGVMEFLLINHPLDCPICDQGGECQLQDLSVGYGASASRYQEEKRVVMDKNLGPLVATDMTRCINCTRCVRFTTEIAGEMELGQAFRGEHAEIMPFVEKTVDSELSGNIIDLCPVGALTSKPFRFSARTWELSRRKSVSPHDSLGSNLVVQVKHDTVKRVLPLENEEINECWLADRDRFSYEALNSADRLTVPMIKQGGEWREVDWQVAIEYVANGLRSVVTEHGADAIGALASAHSTVEELYLLQSLVRGLGSDNVDHRLRQSDFTADAGRAGAPWLGMRIAEVADLDRLLVVGSFFRKDHPLLAQRVRQAAKRGLKLNLVHATSENLLIPVANQLVAAPGALVNALAQVAKGLAEVQGQATDAGLAAALDGVVVGDAAKAIAASLASGHKTAVWLGNYAVQHGAYAQLAALAQEVARLSGARFGVIGEAANSVGGYLAGAVPSAGGLNAAGMLAQPRKAYLVYGAEPELDAANPAAAVAALKSAEMVAVFSAFKSDAALEYADVLLPVSPFTETAGTFVNTEGRIQSFHQVVKPQGDSRPGWKVLRVLGNTLGVAGFDFDQAEAVRHAALGAVSGFVGEGLDNALSGVAVDATVRAAALERVADVPIYFADPISRRAPSLQKTKDAAVPTARLSAATAAGLGLQAGDKVRVSQAGGSAELNVEFDEGVAENCVRVAAAHAATAALGAPFGEISVERL
ncbi:MAG: NADH-quinone oxidoreductase subunit G, partial [Zoogloea sp.]|nr:NADH-quinone oxidoreductase subunit G [Zoogloea sp.]